MKNTKRVMAFVLSCMILVTLVACAPASNNNSSSDDSSSSSGTVKTTLNYGLTGDPANLDPAKTTDQMSRAVWTQIYETCARKRADGTYEPRVAESWSVSEDGKTVTLNIRDDVLFHDGSKLTAEDVAFSLNRLCASPATSGMMTSMTPESAVAVDDKTVEVTLLEPYGAILDVIFIEGRIVSKNAVESMGEEAFALNPVGCGPYRFVERTTGEKIVLTAFEDHFKDDPAIRDITFKIITDSATAVVALEKGELDFLSHAPLTARESLMQSDTINWYETPIAGNIYIIFNCESGPFADKTLRQAIQAGIDKNAMVIGGVEGYGEPISTMIPEACFGYQEDFPDIPYDLEHAKQLLAEAGYANGLNLVLKTQENATYSKPTEVLQGQLQNMGITAEIQKMERGAFFSEYSSSAFDLMIMHWTTPGMDADFLWQLCHSSQIGAGNKGRINDPELDAALDLGRTSLDPEVRMQAYHDVCQIIQDEAYFVPIYTFMAPCAANKDLKNVQADSLYKFYVTDWSW